MSDSEHHPSLNNVIGQDSLRWIFVGGKGGVGKTTCSCSLAVQLASVRESVLLLSTDPAHNLSDAFSQKFTSQPTLVNGFTNLSAMEIDPVPEIDEDVLESGAARNSIMEMMGSIPGVDEAMSFVELMKQVSTMKFSVIVFDTAPTGHTLRLLSLPATLDQCLGKVMQFSDRFSGMFSQFQQMGTMMGMGQAAAQVNPDDIVAKLTSMKRLIEQVLEQFRDPELSTFVCVCIPEFLSLYETERLVQDLTKQDIDTHNIVINQLLLPEPDCSSRLLAARMKMQQKYLMQFDQLYGEDFHITRLPLLEREVRGPDLIKAFSTMTVDPTIIAKGEHWDVLPASK